MKKFLSLVMALCLMASLSVTAFATTDYTSGTDVTYDAESETGTSEQYTLTVPASMAPGDTANTVLAGTWSSVRKVTVTCDPKVTLENSINAEDTHELAITLNNGTAYEVVGNNTEAISETKPVAVAEMPADALFGTWSGHFNYTVVISDVAAASEP